MITGTVEMLYDNPLQSTRSGPLYGAFSYPTKISPEAIALFIATHTNPGDTVFDGFAGSGTTGLAALLCENPPESLRQEAARLGLKVRWGVRNALLYELSTVGSLVARTLTNPPDPRSFQRAAEEILSEAMRAYGWMYGAKDVDGNLGRIRYIIWSDMTRCPVCGSEASLWDLCVDTRPARIGSDFACPTCSHRGSVDDMERLTSASRDNVLRQNRKVRMRRPVRVYGTTGGLTWSRPTTKHDMDVLRRIEIQPIPKSVPCVPIPWGDLYRRGYHTGITHVHHFYTRRNLIAFGRLWERTANYGQRLQQALRFWLLSYNTSHATMMTRVVAKNGNAELVVTGAQPGVLYISGLPVEKNVFDGLRRKMATICRAFRVIHGRKGVVRVYRRSSRQVDLPDASIDYVFTDPPFGGNIPYAEVNFINEAWLGRYTNRADEIIVSSHQNKTPADYQNLLTDALVEANRILKPKSRATIVFHSASAEIWNALQNAYTNAGFRVEHAGILDKTQGSFKQVTTSGAVRGDPVLLLTKHRRSRVKAGGSWDVAGGSWDVTDQKIDPDKRTAQSMYSRVVAHHLENHQKVPGDAGDFYRWHAKRRLLEVDADAGN